MAGQRRIDEAALKNAEIALEAAIKEQKNAGEAARGQMREFAHDAKNALWAVLAYSKILAEKEVDAETYQKYAGAINTSVRRLIDLCETMLADPGAEDADGGGNEPRDVEVVEMVDEVVTLFAQLADDRGIEINTDLSPDFPPIHTVPENIYRSLTNVLSNAVKFTPSGGAIDVKAALDEKEDAVIVIIRNSGEQIPPEQILKMTSPNVTTVSPHGDVGTGYGLPIVNKLMRELGGTMGIASRSESGTEITLRFPKEITRPR